MAPSMTPTRNTSFGQGREHSSDRLSLSPPGQRRALDARASEGHEPPLIPHKNGLRGTTSRTSERSPPNILAGPSYESMSPWAPGSTTISKSESTQRNRLDNRSAQNMHGVVKGGLGMQEQYTHHLQGPSSHSPRATSATSQPLGQSNTIPNSPPRARNPIYPALASPPRENSAAPSSSSPNHRTPSKLERPAGLKVGTTSPELYPRTNSSSRTVTRGSPVSPTHSSRNMHIIASSRASSSNKVSTETIDTPGVRTDKHGRPMMSARRSGTSSSRTITLANAAVIASQSPTSPSPSPQSRSAFLTGNMQHADGLTEAGAYARAMSSSVPRSGSIPLSPDSLEVNDGQRNTGDRPLPRPPGPPTSFTPPLRQAETNDRRHQADQIHAIRSAPSPSPKDPDQSSGQMTKSPYQRRVSSSTPSPSKSRLDPTAPRKEIDLPGNTGYDTPPEILPPVTRSTRFPAHDQRSGKAHLLLESRMRSTNGSILQRPFGRPPFDFLLAHPAIQSSLLSVIGINTFLSLSGSSENVRRQFTGESIGRWVLNEWTVRPPDQAGNRWPNLTVWEGFLESLLHDPATYSTYPARWHNLLRHLSLSHTLVVLYLRNLPQSCYPNHSLLPFEDDGLNQTALPFSPSSASLSSMGQPRSRVGSTVGSETGSVAASRPPRRERVVEIVMPEPLAAKPHHEIASPDVPSKPVRRRGSISSLASVTSFSFGRRRSNSLATDLRSQQGVGNFVSVAEPAASLAPGKAGLPPVSYPSAKRYGFRNASDVPGRRRNPSESRPGSLFSFQTGASTTSYMPRASHIGESRHSGLAETSWPLQAPPPIGVRPRSSFGSVTSSRQSDLGSPVPGRKPGPTVFQRCEPAFDKPMPYIPGRAPVLRVFVPLSERVQRWPSAEGAAAAIEELEKCGALKRMRLGDLIINTAIRAPKTTEHVLLFVPFVKHMLVPLQYKYIPTGHLPSYVDSFALPPSYYYPFLPAPQIIHLNLGPYRDQGLQSMRLASDRRDMTVASGARISAKRYLYVTGVEIGPSDKAAPDWHGMVSLEAEGTAEGKAELERRFGMGDARSAPLAPWEIVKEKSMGGTVWLRLVKERT